MPPLQTSILTSCHSGIIDIRALTSTKTEREMDPSVNFNEDESLKFKQSNSPQKNFLPEKSMSSFRFLEGRKATKTLQTPNWTVRPSHL